MIVHPDRPYRSVRTWPGMRSEYCRLPPGEEPTVTRSRQIGVSFSGHCDLVYARGGAAVRTNLAGHRMRQSAVIPGYEETVGPTRAMITSADGTQPGDPAKAAAAIIAALDADRTPLRLALGHDAVDALVPRLEGVRAEHLEWESVSRSTDFVA